VIIEKNPDKKFSL